MSGSIDDRIVRMQFDNQKFEKNVQTSLNTIEKLKKALKLKNAAKGFEAIDKAANSINFNGLSQGIQQVHNNFNFLDSFVINIFNRISNAAINLGQTIVKNLAIDPITTGFQEYETKMNSIQVIAANTGALNQDAAQSAQDIEASFQAVADIWKRGNLGNGEARVQMLNALGLDYDYVQSNVNKIANGLASSLDEVYESMQTGGEEGGTTIAHIEDVLDNLNHYADKTIYNFTQMTQAIGQFTTAGIDVDTSATAVKGIANLAAYVGAPASDASRSMFQLSQALATGRVRLQDWMSLEHTAGMGGKVFQNALIKTAEKHGIAVQEMIEANRSFRESLREDWLTSDVLTETLAQFSGDFDERYWEELGYTEAEIKDIMNLGQVATDAATKVRTFTQMWDALKEAAQSGWTETWQYIVGGFEDAPKLWTAVNNAITGIIDPMNDARNEALKFWYSAKIGGRSNWFSAIDKTNDVLDENGKKIAKVDDEGNELKDTYGRIIYETEEITEYSGILVDVWDALGQVVEPVKDAFDTVFDEHLGKLLLYFTTRVKEFSESLKKSDKHSLTLYVVFVKVFSIVKKVIGVFGKVANLAGTIISSIARVADAFLTLTDEMYATGEEGLNIEGIFDTIGEAIDTVSGFIEDLTDKFLGSEGAMKIFRGLIDGVTGAFKIASAIIGAVGKIFGHVIEKVTPMADGFTDAAGSVVDFVKNSIDVDKVVEWIGNAADGIIDFMDNFDLYFGQATDAVGKWIKETTGVDIDQVWGWVLENVENIKTNLIDVDGIKFDNLKTVLDSLKESSPMLQNISSFIDTFKKGSEEVDKIPETITETRDAINGLKYEAGTKTFESFSTAFEKVGDALDVSNINAKDFVGLASSIGLAFTVFQGLNIVNKVNDFVQGFVDIKDKAIGAIGAITKSFKSMQDYMKSTMILNIAIAIGILTLSLIALSMIPEEQISRAMAVLIGLFVGLSSVLKNLSKALSFINGATGSLGFVMLGLGLSFLAMAAAIAIIASIDEDKLGPAVGVIYGVLYACQMLFKAMSRMNAFDVKTVADSIMTIALAIVVIAGAIALLSIPGIDYQEGLSVVSGIALGIAGIIWILSGTANPAKLEGVAATVMTMAVAIDVIVGGLIALMYNVAAVESIKAGSVKQATDALYGIMGMMGMMVLALGFMAKISDGNKIAASVGTILAIAGAIDAMAGIVIAISVLANMGTLWSSMAAVVALAGLLVVCATVLRLVSALPIKSAIAMPLIIGSIVGGFASLVGLVALLAALDPTSLQNGISALTTIAIILGALVVIGSVMAAILLVSGAGEALVGLLTSLAPALLSMAAVMLAFGASILAIAAAAWIFVDAWTKLWALLKDIGDNGPEVFDKLATNLSGAIPVLLAIATTHLPQLLETIDIIVETFLDHASTMIPYIVAKVVEILLSNVPGFVAGILMMLKNVLDAIATAAPDILNSVVVLIIALLNGLGAALEANSDALAAAVGQALIGIFSVIVSLIKTFWNWWMSEEVQAFMYKVWDAIFGFFTMIGNFFKGIWDAYVNWWTGIWVAIVSFFKGIWEGILGFFDNVRIGIEDAISGIVNFFVGIWNGIVEFVTGIPGAVANFFVTMFVTIVTWISNIITFLKELPMNIAKIIIDTIMEADNGFTSFLKKLLLFWFKLYTKLTSGVEKIKNFGIKFVTGFIDGIKSMVEKAKETVTGLAENVVGWFTGKDGLDEHSPSKEAEESGELFGQGFVNGLNGMLDPVKDATSGLANSATDSFDISGIQDDLDSTLGDNQYSIDIIPNIDYSQMTTTGEADYSSLWGGNLDASGLGIDGEGFDLAQYTNADITQAYDYEEPEPYDDTNVINAIKELNGRINAIAEGLTGMDVYLDKNVLVGEIAGPLDAEFSRRSTRASRGSGR